SAGESIGQAGAGSAMVAPQHDGLRAAGRALAQQGAEGRAQPLGECGRELGLDEPADVVLAEDVLRDHPAYLAPIGSSLGSELKTKQAMGGSPGISALNR